tara:strand:- start:5322 stop:5990 length:669 start_codon:yes stop_codon:yes gene_type:complete
MKSKILFIAPHPDDETLGCGGTILKHKKKGDDIYWLIITSMQVNSTYSKSAVEIRKKEIEEVSGLYGFKEIFQLDHLPSSLDAIPKKDLINDIIKVINHIKPETIYLPHFGDVHSDHRIIFDAVIACTKSFRNKDIKNLIAYETVSETEFNVKGKSSAFVPNLWIDIEEFLDKKVEIMNTYKSEILDHPFPRSEKNVVSLSSVRGSNVGLKVAESFMILKEI